MKKRFLPFLCLLIQIVIVFGFSAKSNAQVKVTGTAIGTSGSWGNNPETTFTAALDGDISTFFDGLVSSSFVGYDFGEGNDVLLTSIRYVPRSTHPQRMVGGQIWGSNTNASFDNSNDYDILYTITEEPLVEQYNEALISSTKSYRYLCYHDNNSCNVAEIEFYGSVTTAIGDVESSKVIITGGTGLVRVQNCKQGDSVVIYDLIGKVISKGVTSSTYKQVYLPTGLYIVKVAGNQIITKKVYVN